ncbi:HpcH/HpaI aldolase/citrate lyase family protein [Bacillus canaveralius]|uniref:HpcH/HpaI aldolase/citrate lyase family protein n=1 Tax=Bacillus canaveralius TaxID=1403243 RepID=UPI000F7AF1D4|nr:CoA ester lyase [Bacillus canaveralius]RSK55150.1 CoA ester lyase [Bacillus canaveralius]
MKYRSFLFTPGTQKEKLIKSLSSDADALIWDLEDAVHPVEKAVAQTILKEVLEELEENVKPIFLRVNSFDSPWFADDVKLARYKAVRGVLLPKTENAVQVEETWNLTNNEGELITLIETAKGLRDLENILINKHITGVALGAIDLAVDLDLTLTDSGLELIYAKSRIVTLARAAGISGIFDSVFADISNPESLKRRATQARMLGFNGQMAVHPKQIEILHEAYSPTQSEIEWSKRVLKVVEEEAAETGVFTLDGKMIDRPVIERAKQIYTVARQFMLIS